LRKNQRRESGRAKCRKLLEALRVMNRMQQSGMEDSHRLRKGIETNVMATG
jgi:hypothetical protein